MNSDEIKAELKNEVKKYVETIDKLPIKCFHEKEIMQRYVFSKLKWRFSLCLSSYWNLSIWKLR